MRNLKEEIQSVVDIYKSGNLSRAEIISKKLLEENPKIVFLYNLLGLILSEQRKINEAISCYSKGIKVDPNYAMNYNNLGILLFYNHRFVVILNLCFEPGFVFNALELGIDTV